MAFGDDHDNPHESMVKLTEGLFRGHRVIGPCCAAKQALRFGWKRTGVFFFFYDYSVFLQPNLKTDPKGGSENDPENADTKPLPTVGFGFVSAFPDRFPTLLLGPLFLGLGFRRPSLFRGPMWRSLTTGCRVYGESFAARRQCRRPAVHPSRRRPAQAGRRRTPGLGPKALASVFDLNAARYAAGRTSSHCANTGCLQNSDLCGVSHAASQAQVA